MDISQTELTPLEDAASRSKSRKRTKTGCLTCRKRRIKCGEERPICKNCVKSKRHCDGYNQRVVFKPPAFDYRPVPHGGLHITFPADPNHFNTMGNGNGWDMYGVRPENVSQQPPVDPQMLLHGAHGSIANQLNPSLQYPQHPDLRLQQQTSPPHGSSVMLASGQHTPAIGVSAPHNAMFSADMTPDIVFPSAEPSYSPRQAQLVDGHNLFRSVDGRPVHDLSAHSILNLADPTQLLHDAAVETHHNHSYYDTYHDQDIYGDILPASHDPQHHALGSILRLNSISIQDLQTRRYDTFLYAGMLDTYRVERVASPLNNPATARIFAHFLSSTAPSLSIFEKHPRNSSVLFSSGAIPFSEQGLWTYNMPKLALHDQGLLHAMLALGSLHIAKLTGAARTPSVQHYAWALKRVHHCVGHPQKRLEIATIAASMLLGYYEIIAADHMKWNLHLAGSRQLFLETDFAGMTQRFRNMKLARAAEFQAGSASPSAQSSHPQGDLLDQIPDIDERLVSRMVGREVRYGTHGYIDSPGSSVPAALNLSDFEVLKDLFWWYCKQDAYMSVTGGIPLLLDYSRWADCPPRAPLGKIDAVYGSFDHLTLLLGRVADFAARDRARKLRQVAANGGSWRPHKDMNMAPPPPASGQAFGMTPENQPGFYGMAPPPKTAGQMPSSYHPAGHNRYESDGADDHSDLSAATEAAIQEYNSIRTALHEFSQSLGESFAPLSSEYQPPMETPFGPALFYRNYDIGCLWAIYNMTILILIRSHPHMPPAAHMAAAVAARETEFYANEIGRISAGIVPDSPDRPLSPALGAALCESCMPSFFAAIQYKDAAQRETTVKRIFGISRRTGWGSAELIANGCETAWVKAAAAGRGPPYTRLGRQENSNDPRLNGSWETLDPEQDANETDDGDRRLVKKSHRARVLWGIGVIGEESDETAKR